MVKQNILTVCLATFPHYVCKGYEAYLRYPKLRESNLSFAANSLH